MINLPLTKSVGKKNNPKLFLIYAPPKTGKTTLLSTLPNNLILDLEAGSDYVEAMSVKIIGWTTPIGETSEQKEARCGDTLEPNDKKYYMDEVGKQIILSGRPYKFITVDTATMLEDMILPLALAKYLATPMGKNYEGTDIRDLAKGSGYLYLRLAFKEAVEKIKKLADHVILIGHLKDTIVEKGGKEVVAKDIDLTGKIRNITCSDADAVGYLHRGPNNELLINFKSADEIVCGSRCNHLRGKEIKIADYDEASNELVNVDWSLIYPDTF